MKRRLFVGTFLPKSDQDSLGELQEHSEKLAAEWQRKLRWVRPEKLHLTWVFLGSVDEDYIPEIQSKLTALLAEQPPLDVVYSKPTFWPGPKHARTFVLTPDTVSDEVMNLADRIKRDMKPYAEKIEPKYRPHITVMRFDGNTRGRLSVPQWWPLMDKLPIAHHIGQIDLIESHMGSHKGYEAIFTLPLRRAGP